MKKLLTVILFILYASTAGSVTPNDLPEPGGVRVQIWFAPDSGCSDDGHIDDITYEWRGLTTLMGWCVQRKQIGEQWVDVDCDPNYTTYRCSRCRQTYYVREGRCDTTYIKIMRIDTLWVRVYTVNADGISFIADSMRWERDRFEVFSTDTTWGEEAK